MEKVEAWLVDCRLSGCQAIQKAWFAQFVSSPERHGGVRCMKRKLNLPLRGHFQRKICIMWGGGEGMENSGLCPEKSPKYRNQT